MKPRLQAIADMVEPGSRIIDIGSDHLILANALYDGGICQSVYASDLNQGPLQSMRANRGERAIELFQADGLLGVTADIDSAIITGMGGQLILDIIFKALERFQSLDYVIIQPMQQIELCREGLQPYFEVVAERLVAEEQKIYHVLKLRPGQDHYDSYLTKGLAPAAERKQYYAQEIERWQKIKAQVPPQRAAEIAQRLDRLRAAIML